MESTTIIREVKSNPQDRIQIEIGDSKQPDFKPQFKVSRWDNEVNFSMRAQEESGAVMVEEDGKVKYKTADIEVHQYEKPDAGEDGGFEFEWVLNKKPESNVLRTTIQHKGLDFNYQPEITDEEAQASSYKGDRRTLTEIKREMRPENVVGSYAVYHKTNRNNATGGNEYKTGKAFHIYRPHAIDANGAQVWCDLDITEGELTVTVPEDFLNKASYPVVLDPTFGFTSAGATNQTLATNPFGILNGRAGSTFPAPSNGTLDSVSAYVGTDGASTFSSYASVNEEDSISAGSHGEIKSVLDNSISGSFSWRTYTLAGSASISNGVNYVINVNADSADLAAFETASLKYDSGSTQSYRDNPSSTAFNLADPWVPDIDETRDYSTYATYTASTNSGFLMFM